MKHAEVTSQPFVAPSCPKGGRHCPHARRGCDVEEQPPNRVGTKDGESEIQEQLGMTPQSEVIRGDG